MMILNDDIKLQIVELSKRVTSYNKKLKRTLLIALLTGFASIACFSLKSLFNIELSDIDIPSSLISSYDGKFGSLNSVVSSAISILKYFGLLGIPLFIMMIIKNGTGALALALPAGTVAVFSFVGASLIEDPSPSFENNYINSVMQKIVNYPANEQLSTHYIDLLNKTDERYVLAQAAILSNSNFPASFFKSVSTEIKANGKFIPTDEAIYSIETSAYGKPQTPKVVERAEKIATYRSILDLAGHASIGSFVSFLLFGTGLSLIRRSIRNRLDKIYSLIDTSNDEHGDQ